MAANFFGAALPWPALGPRQGWSVESLAEGGKPAERGSLAGEGGAIMSEVNTETLLAAIQDGESWMARFTGKEYNKAYQDYRTQYGPLFREAALAGGGEEIAALAEVLLDGLAEGWARQKPWNRSLAMLSSKQMIVCFLSPMLMEDPVCVPLEKKLREGWAARWPKEAYKAASLEKIQKGFRPAFLGIPLPFMENSDEE